MVFKLQLSSQPPPEDSCPATAQIRPQTQELAKKESESCVYCASKREYKEGRWHKALCMCIVTRLARVE